LEMLFLSIHPRYVEMILAGTKTIELRRQRPRDIVGDWIAVYATTPVRCLKGIVQVKEVHIAGVQELWREFQSQAGISKKDYEFYFSGIEQAVGIELANPVSFTKPISLCDLRKEWPGFQPPQGFRYLDADQTRFVNSFAERRLKKAA